MELYNKKVGNIKTEEFGNIEIFQTNDYDLFKDAYANRNIDNGHVKRLLKSMTEKLLFTLVFVNEKMQTIDGQHRIEALKLGEQPVLYAIILGYGSDELGIYNSNMLDWSVTVYAKHYSDLGKKDYTEYIRFRSVYGLGHDVSYMLLLGITQRPSKNHRDAFVHGRFVINSHEFATRIASLVKSYSFYPGWNTRNFVLAYLEIYKNPNFDVKRFYEAFKKYHTLMDGVGGEVRHFLRIMESIYNYHRKDKSMIYNHLKYAC